MEPIMLTKPRDELGRGPHCPTVGNQWDRYALHSALVRDARGARVSWDSHCPPRGSG